jgi:hypothetical protein
MDMVSAETSAVAPHIRAGHIEKAISSAGNVSQFKNLQNLHQFHP